MLNKIIAITWKDIIAEMRTKEVLTSVFIFTILVIVLFTFAFGGEAQTMAAVAPGVLWATFAFAGVLALNRTFVPEKEQGCLEGLMLCPVPREVIYLGKMLGSLIFLLLVEAITLPIFAALFNVPVLTLPVILVTLLTTVGFVAVGTLFSALSINTRAREMVLPILFFPVVAPIIIAAVMASGMALGGQPWGDYLSWIEIILAFDVIFLVVSFLIFSFVIEE
ncbi:MAG: heme exporter protein CcmB [Dehalococcoidales bacterium]|nr:heme exporter protein CcmB [Dehalococcoidales bacterium]